MKRFGKKFGTTCFIIAALMLTFIQVAVLSAAQMRPEPTRAYFLTSGCPIIATQNWKMG